MNDNFYIILPNTPDTFFENIFKILLMYI